MTWPELVSTLGRCDEEQAFVYFAEVGTVVETSVYGLNPGLSAQSIAEILAPRPPWLGSRPDLLGDAWPEAPPQTARDLIRLALLSCKAMLGLGAMVKDGSLAAMQHEFAQMFPDLARSAGDSREFRSCHVQIAIRATGSHETWFQVTGIREGRELPVEEPASAPDNGWSQWEIAIKNLLRLDLQRLLEQLS